MNAHNNTNLYEKYRDRITECYPLRPQLSLEILYFVIFLSGIILRRSKSWLFISGRNMKVKLIDLNV